MGSCVAMPMDDDQSDLLGAIERLSSAGPSIQTQLIPAFVDECKLLTRGAVDFFYATPRWKPGELYPDLAPKNKFTEFVPIILGSEFGKLGVTKTSDKNRRDIKALSLFVRGLLLNNKVQRQTDCTRVIGEAQRKHKSVFVVVGKICHIIRDALQCEYVSLLNVDTSNSTKRFIQIFPKNIKIAFPFVKGGILSNVASTRRFAVHTKDVEKGLEDAMKEDALRKFESIGALMCVPIINAEKQVCAEIVVVNERNHACFTSSDVELLQAVSREMRHILEGSATKLLIDGADRRVSETDSLLAYIGAKMSMNMASDTDLNTECEIDDTLESEETKDDELADPVPAAPPLSKSTSLSRRPTPSMLLRRASLSCGSVSIDKVRNLYGEYRPMLKDNPLERILDLSFDPFEHSKDELAEIALTIFDDLALLKIHRVDKDRFMCFVRRILSLYRANPYHNASHGFMVLAFAFGLTKQTELSAQMQPLDLFALLVSALCHDVDHPGNTNAFEVDTCSELANRYNDRHVLENHHCAVTFRTLNEAECNFISHFSSTQRKAFRKRVIGAILSTDMSGHVTMCHQLDSIEKHTFRINLKVKLKDDEKTKQSVCNVLLHTADLVANVQPLPIAMKWAKSVCEEFTSQV